MIDFINLLIYLLYIKNLVHEYLSRVSQYNVGAATFCIYKVPHWLFCESLFHDVKGKIGLMLTFLGSPVDSNFSCYDSAFNFLMPMWFPRLK